MQTPPITPVVKNLIIVNVGIFIIDYLLQVYHGIPLSYYFGLKHVQATSFYPFQFITYMFLHADIGHLFFNMLGLFMMGSMLELIWGSKRFFQFYLITGIGAGIIYSLVRYFEWYQVLESYPIFTRQFSMLDSPCVGASGAIFGIIAGLAIVMPNREMWLFLLPFPVKMKHFAIGYCLIELYSGVNKVQGDQVAHFAHLGGALVAFLYLRVWNK